MDTYIFFYFPPPISTRVNIITPLEKLSGNIKNSQKVQKGVYQIVKISFSKKQQQILDLIHTFLDLKQLFLIFPLNFPNGVFIFTLVDIGRAKSEKIVSTKPSYKFDQYMALL